MRKDSRPLLFDAGENAVQVPFMACVPWVIAPSARNVARLERLRRSPNLKRPALAPSNQIFLGAWRHEYSSSSTCTGFGNRPNSFDPLTDQNDMEE
ncbi:MAG: hypothetical protein M3Z35_00360 [Nitrospirota bacterium]|nr:hypothetical protein [Nitrospirota bacterium]